MRKRDFSALKLTKKLISELLKDLIPLIEAVFGPHKGSILVKTQSPSSIKIAKSGKDILSLFEEKHPIYRQLFKYLKGHIELYGDGSKTILLLLNYFMHKIQEICHLSKVHILREVIKIKEGFIPLIHANSFKDVIPMDPIKILETFFTSRFSESVSKHLIDIIICIYDRRVSLKKFASKSVLIEYEGISSSRILHLERKYLFDHRFSNPLKINPSYFIVWLREEDHESPSNIISITTNKETTDVSDFVSTKDRKIESFIRNTLKGREIQVLLCNFGLEEHLKYQLFKNRILVVEYIETDELQDLCNEISIHPWKGEVGDEIHEMNIGETDGFEELYLANNSFKTVMKLPKYSNLSFFHPIICGPTLEIAKSYYESSLEALSLLYSNNKGMTKFGDFERHVLHLFLMDYLSKNGRFAEPVHLIYIDLLTYWTSFSKMESVTRSKGVFYYGYDSNTNILSTFHELIEFLLRTEYILPMKSKSSSQEAKIKCF